MAHLPEWRRVLMGADSLEDLRLRSSTTDTYRRSLREYCSFCAARGAIPLPATLGLLRGYIYHCTSHRSLAPSTIAGRLAAISDCHRLQLPHLHLAGRPTLNPCKDESINTLISILERRTVRPAKGRLPLWIPDLRAMLHRGFPLSSAFGRYQRMCITFLNLGCLRRAAAATLTCDYRVSSSSAVSYTDLSAVRMLFNAELGCRYIACAWMSTRTLTPVTSASPTSQTTCLAWLPARSARVIAHVGHWACRQDALDAYFKTSATEILRLIAAL
eukprot:jgi/Tetstr1/459555/TSEL_004920.t1